LPCAVRLGGDRDARVLARRGVSSDEMLFVLNDRITGGVEDPGTARSGQRRYISLEAAVICGLCTYSFGRRTSFGFSAG
jgi:hypothetical protein